MNSKIDVPVLIAGAGPVGLAAAVALDAHRVGLSIIESGAARTALSKALVVWARSLEQLDGMIDITPFLSGGIQPAAAHIFADGHSIGRIDLSLAPSTYGPGTMIPQSATETILEEHLNARNINVERVTTLISFTDNGDFVECNLRDATGQQTTRRARWLVGCDGARSTVRKALDLPFPGQEDPNDWLLADINQIEGPIPPAEVRVYWHRDGICVFFPLGDRRFRVVANRTPDGSTSRERRNPTLEEMQSIVATRANREFKLHNPTWMSEFFIHERKVEHYRVGRVFLAGDAAHIHSPAGGQGMNTGIQDAINLAWKLALVERGIAGEPLLDSYSTERSSVGDQVLRTVSIVTSVATIRNRLAQRTRNLVAELALHLPAVQDNARRGMPMLSIDYRGSPLTATAVRGHGQAIAAGDRIPDVEVTDSEGRTAGLSSALSARGFTVIVAEPEDSTELSETVAAARQAVPDPFTADLRVIAISWTSRKIRGASRVLVDETDALPSALGLGTHRALLVRPDRYAALHFDPGRPDSLVQWFDNLH